MAKQYVPDEFEVVGISDGSFDTADHKHIDGKRIHVIFKRAGIDGYGCSTFFMSKSRLDNLPAAITPGSHYRAVFNSYGQVSDLSVIK